MAKKQHERSELEAVRAENRKLKAIIKELEKQVGRANKAKAHYEDREMEIAEQFLEEEVKEQTTYINSKLCLECGIGTIEEIPLGVRKVITCSKCQFRRVVKV